MSKCWGSEAKGTERNIKYGRVEATERRRTVEMASKGYTGESRWKTRFGLGPKRKCGTRKLAGR